MISRQSKPRSPFSRLEPMKLDSPRTQEATAGKDEGASSVFLCVAVTSRRMKGKMAYFRSNAVGEDAEAARALAALCLDQAPEHHRWRHHTVAERRTFAILAGDDGRTYFAVAEPTPGSAETIRFLERVRDACSAAPRKRHRYDAATPVVQQFARTLQARAGTAGASSSMANAVLTGDSASDEDEEALHAVQQEEGAPRPRRLSWRRHALVVIGVDVAVCLVLFGVWMAVCRGFSCVQR